MTEIDAAISVKNRVARMWIFVSSIFRIGRKAVTLGFPLATLNLKFVRTLHAGERTNILQRAYLCQGTFERASVFEVVSSLCSAENYPVIYLVINSNTWIWTEVIIGCGLEFGKSIFFDFQDELLCIVRLVIL